jgi:hypothetical protein
MTTNREQIAHRARVWLAEASRNRAPRRADWHARALAGAARARRELAAALAEARRSAAPVQIALF